MRNKKSGFQLNLSGFFISKKKLKKIIYKYHGLWRFKVERNMIFLISKWGEKTKETLFHNLEYDSYFYQANKLIFLKG